MITVRFYRELNDSLNLDLRGRPVQIPDTPSTVRQLIDGFRVSADDVDLVLVNGRSTGLDEDLADSDHVSVYPVFESLDISRVGRVRAVPLRRTRFALDVHLGALARLLRMLGFDSSYDRRAEDAWLADLAATEGRILLSRDTELLARRAVTRAYRVRAVEPLEQAVEVVRRFDLAAAARPLTRCLRCNLPLAAPAAPPATVPAAVRASHRVFRECLGCGRTYWRGTHWQHMVARAAGLLAASREQSAPVRP